MKRSPLRRRTPLRAKRKTPESKIEYAELRVEIMDRSMGRCDRKAPCCWGMGSDVHHVVRRSQGGSDDPANLKWLCRPCHQWIHDHVAESKREGWLA